ncbi:unnamed protein product [Lactuca virosa]|uniref:DOMON domain-containing protein n=1 Tax=Lactuca virosa TaxID=75947 RepID=A0AAU9MLK7_9ASTR|nr:unnamed protein product [Lactuca virosa]
MTNSLIVDVLVHLRRGTLICRQLHTPFNASTIDSDNITHQQHTTTCLHWSLHALKNTFSIAFVACPATTDGWISWAINPTGEGLAGA